MRQFLHCSLVFLLGCATGSFAPTIPLTRTPDEAWRKQAPAVAVQRDVSLEKPLIARQASDGTTLVVAQIPDAPYTTASLVARQQGSYAQAELVSDAMVKGLRFRNGKAPSIERIDALGVALSYRCEPGGLDAVLASFRELLRQPPPAEAFAQARTEYLRRSGAELTYLPLPVLQQALLEQLFPSSDPIVRGPELHLRTGRRGLDDAQLAQTFFDLFRPGNRALIVVGPESPEELFARVEAPLSATWPEPVASAQIGASVARGNAAVVVDQPVNMPIVGFGVRVPAADRVSGELMQRLLVSNLQGGLHGSIREKEGLTYVVHTYFEEGPSGGFLWGWFQVDDYKAGQAASLLRQELAHLAHQFEASDLEALQNAAILEARLISRSPQRLSTSLARHFARGTDWGVGPREDLIAAALPNVQSSLQRIFAQPYLAIAGDLSNIAASLQWTSISFETFEPLAN